jgi:hypothetical protein
MAFLDLTKPASNNANPPSIKKIIAPQIATQIVSIAFINWGCSTVIVDNILIK